MVHHGCRIMLTKKMMSNFSLSQFDWKLLLILFWIIYRTVTRLKNIRNSRFLNRRVLGPNCLHFFLLLHSNWVISYLSNVFPRQFVQCKHRILLLFLAASHSYNPSKIYRRIRHNTSFYIDHTPKKKATSVAAIIYEIFLWFVHLIG